MSNESVIKNNFILKVTILFLVALLLGLGGFFYKTQEQSKAVQNMLKAEKTAVLKDLAIAKDSLNVAIAANTNLSAELIAERDKIQLLMAEVDVFKGDISSLGPYKTESQKFKNNVERLMRQVFILNEENKKLTSVIDETKTKLVKAVKYSDTLKSQNLKMATKIEKAARLTILNLQSTAYKQKSSGKKITTDKANKTDVLKVSFMIAENEMAKSGDKTYHVQIIDGRGNVLGDKLSESFKTFILYYSFMCTVKYENITVKVEKELPVTDIKPGTYFINIYDKDELVAKNNFILK
jgi:hypothetical protein